MKVHPAIYALSFGAFGIGVTEFSPMGLLPVMAEDLGVSIPVAGLLVSAYAAGVMLGAPILTLATTRVPRKLLLIGLMGIFALGNLLSAIAGSYGLLVAARVVTSLCHGSFFGVGSIVAASVVPADRRAGAVAAMFMGLTIANVAGVPLATWAGESFGWRPVFLAISGIGVAVMAALVAALPGTLAIPRIDARAELRTLADRRVLIALAVTTLQSGAMFTVFTYIAPILRDVTHMSTAFVSAMLVLYGIGLTVGNWLGGWAADRSPSVERTLAVGLISLAVLLSIFAVTMHWPVPAAISIFAWGVATFAMVPPLQLWVMQSAEAAPNLASSMNIGAFNMGNALGAAAGGAVIGLGFGFPVVALAGAALAGSALLLMLAARPRTIVAQKDGPLPVSAQAQVGC